MSDAEEWQNIGGWYDRLTHWRYGHGIVPANYCAGSHEFSVDVRFALREIAALRARAERAEADVVKAIGYLTRNCLAPRGAKPHDDLMGICTQVDHLLSTARAEALREALEIIRSRVQVRIEPHFRAAASKIDAGIAGGMAAMADDVAAAISDLIMRTVPKEKPDAS